MKDYANYRIVKEETTMDVLVIRDIGPWNEFMTVTNAADKVVEDLALIRKLWNGRKLLYYDSNGHKDEILHQDGEFLGFRVDSRAVR